MFETIALIFIVFMIGFRVGERVTRNRYYEIARRVDEQYHLVEKRRER